MNGRWIKADRVIAAEPGPRDVCVVTLVDGRRVSIDHALDYGKALSAAYELAGQLVGPVKVLPMTGSEFMGFLGLTAADFPSSPEADAKDKELAIRSCREILRDGNDASLRREAFDLLAALCRQT